MRRFIVRCLLNGLSFFIAAKIIPGIRVMDVRAGLYAGLLLGITYLLLRPLILVLALPVNLLTLGLFTWVIDTWLVMLAARLSSGIIIPGFGEAVGAALLISGVNLLFGRYLKDKG